MAKSQSLEQLRDEIQRHEVEHSYEPGDIIAILDYTKRLLDEVDALRARVSSLEKRCSGNWNP